MESIAVSSRSWSASRSCCSCCGGTCCRWSPTWSGSGRTRSSARSTRPKRPRGSSRTPDGRFDNAVQQAEAEAARIRDDARADATRIREELTAQAEAEVERMLQRGRTSSRPSATRSCAGCAPSWAARRWSWPSGPSARSWPTTAPAAPPSTASFPRSRTCRRRGAARRWRPGEGPSRWRPYCSPPAASRSPRPRPGSTTTSTPPGRPISAAWPTTCSRCSACSNASTRCGARWPTRRRPPRRAAASPTGCSPARSGARRWTSSRTS